MSALGDRSDKAADVRGAWITQIVESHRQAVSAGIGFKTLSQDGIDDDVQRLLGVWQIWRDLTDGRCLRGAIGGGEDRAENAGRYFNVAKTLIGRGALLLVRAPHPDIG